MAGKGFAEVLIVGAGHAGVQLAIGLGKLEPARRVLLVGDEAGLPYERPPLTKRLLYGGPEVEPIPLRSAEYWASSAVVLRAGIRVVRVDPVSRLACTVDGDAIAYGSLVWATGGRAARSGVPGEQLAGVHSIRSYDDLTRLRADLTGAASAVIIGGGYVGLEVASALRSRGLAVTVVELAPRVLSRVTGTAVSQFFTALHRERGVDVRVGVGVDRIVERGGRAAAVLLSDGTELDADVVVIGVGMRPDVGTLLEAGARGDAGGVEVDAACRTSLPQVFAIGDCAKQVSPWSASPGAIRIESVHNASTHSSAVIRAMSGLPAVAPPPPRFWSTQFGHELRSVGLPSSADEQVMRGDVDAGRFSVAYLRDGVLAAMDTINRPRDFARAQALVVGRWRPSGLGEIVDAGIELPRLTAVEAAAIG